MTDVVRFATTTADRDAAYALRREVFVDEQHVPRLLDRDVHDESAYHVVVLDEAGRCVGTGRALRVDERTWQVGRMVTAADRRGSGVGGAVLEMLERLAALRGAPEIVVHAQLATEPFYAKRGFVTEGAPFDDQGVAHVVMRKRLAR